MKVTGTLNVKIQYEDQFKKLVLVVTAVNGPSLLGGNWLNHISLNWKTLFAGRTAQWHKQLFAEGVGTVEPYKVLRQVHQGAKLRFFKPQPVTFAIRDAARKELDRPEQQVIH